MSDTTSKDLQIFQLGPKHQRFIQLYLTGNFTQAKIAELLEVHPKTVTQWMKNPEIRSALDEAQLEIHDQVAYQLKAMTVKATNRLSSLMDSPMDAIAIQAVRDVLDRGGHKTKNEIKVEKTVTTVEQRMKEIIDMTIPELEMEEIIDE